MLKQTYGVFDIFLAPGIVKLTVVLVVFLLSVPAVVWSDELPDSNDNEFIMEEEEQSEDSLAESLFGDDTPDQDRYQSILPDTTQQKITLKASYHLSVTDKFEDKGYREDPDDKPTSRELEISNVIRTKFFIKTSPQTKYYIDLDLSLKRTYDQNEDGDSGEKNYKDEFDFNLKEAYVDEQIGRHFFKIGKQKINISKISFEMGDVDLGDEMVFSPLNVLETGDRKPLSVKYLWAPQMNHSLTLFYSPIYIRTENEQDSLDMTENDDSIAQYLSDVEKDAPVRDHGGFIYKYSADYLELEIGAFRWFDTDNFKYATSSDPQIDGSSDIFLEKEQKVDFGTLGLGLAFDDIEFKMEAIHYPEKSFYYLTQQNRTVGSSTHLVSSIETYRLPFQSVSIALEKRWDFLYFMPVLKHNRIENVPANIQIFQYENKKTPETEERTLEKNELFLLFFSGLPSTLSGLSGNLQLLAGYYESHPFMARATFFMAKWIPLNSHTKITLTGKSEETEKILITDQAIKKTSVSLDIAYLW